MKEQDRSARDLGSQSPASKEAKEQGMSGARGGPQEAGPRPETERQPPQTSGRRDPRHEHAPEQRAGFGPENAPSNQGDGEPSPERIARNQQGIEARSGSPRAQDHDAVREAQAGEPRDAHTSAGRQQVPGKGDRPSRP
jgi:hypothetical protein